MRSGRVSPSHVLTYRKKGAPRSTVRRYYLKWRQKQDPPLPLDRCDNESCRFHSAQLEWNGEALPLILDHKNGNNTDDRPKNLRLLCPNCDAQQVKTRGGANRGRVQKAEGGFAIVSKSGRRDFVLPLE